MFSVSAEWDLEYKNSIHNTVSWTIWSRHKEDGADKGETKRNTTGWIILEADPFPQFAAVY